MKYAGVVVLMYPKEEINRNIKSYINNLEKLYIIDNTPNTDNSKMLLTNKKIEYIPNFKNLGIAEALNIGAKRAIDEGFDWLLTMDQDSSFKENSLTKMQDFVKEIKTGNIVCKLMGFDYQRIGLIAPFYKLKKNSPTPKSGIEMPLMVMTSGNLINLRAYQKVGNFKNWLFIDCVDFDYCLNLRRHNYEIIQLNNSILNHHLGETKEYKFLWRKVTSSNHSPIRKYYLVRNRHYIYDMYHKYYPLYCNLEISRTKREMLKILLFEKNKFTKIKYMIKGYIDYKKGIKGELKYEKRK